MAWSFPGTQWFHAQLVPAGTPTEPPDARATMAIWQLVNCYVLLGLISSLVFRAVRDALPNNPEAQERVLGASFTAQALADVTHVIVSWSPARLAVFIWVVEFNDPWKHHLNPVSFQHEAGLVCWDRATEILLWPDDSQGTKINLRSLPSSFRNWEACNPASAEDW